MGDVDPDPFNLRVARMAAIAGRLPATLLSSLAVVEGRNADIGCRMAAQAI
jgi:hypothetical protein